MTITRANASLFIGPGLLLAAHLVQLTPSAHDTASELASLDAADARALWSTVVGFAGVIVTVAGLVALGRRLQPSRLATVGTAMSVVGGFALTALLGSSPLMISVATSEGPQDLLVRIADGSESSWVTGVWVGLMLLGWTLGPVVLAVSLWRAGGSWVPLVLLVLGVVLMVLDLGRWELAAAFAATWSGLAYAAWTTPGQPAPLPNEADALV